jgi:hypothetical protein
MDMLDRKQLSLAVAHADVAAEMISFHSSAGYFHTGELDRRYWKDVRTLAQVVDPLTLAKRAFVFIEGDVLADVTVPDDGTVVVYGNVHSSVQINGHGELVIAGDVSEGASIFSDGIFRVFVGGDLAGCLSNRGSCTAWIEGHLRGQVWTGSPSTHLHVRGDCTATIRPSEEPSLLFMEVSGFMAYASLEATASVGYTEFNASIGTSDRPAGIYPDKTTYNALRQHRSYNRWVIRDTACKRG